MNSEVAKIESVSGPCVVTTAEELDRVLNDSRQRRRRIGLVPTMGALHAGHLSLVQTARVECDVTVVTIFVNPSQFGPREDYSKYPRAMAVDLDLLAAERADVVFAPTDEMIYPKGFSTYIEPPAVAAEFEGQCRPGHFRGVATVVLKLFHLVRPEMAFFGQKDYQQCLVIRRMVSDLNVPVTIRVCPTVREPDGLAMSSRNKYLSPKERERAVAISRSLRLGQDQIESGVQSAAAVRHSMIQMLADSGIERIEYVGIADAETLVELDTISSRVVLLIAAYVGNTRLIDNLLVE